MAATPQPIEEHLLKYRDTLVSADQKAQEEFDKAVLALSGGALGVSLVFLKDIIGSNPIKLPELLMAAWVCWAFSTLSVLTSYYLAHKTIRRMIEQIDDGKAYAPGFGDWYAKATLRLNAAGAILFFVGVLLITSFACFNLSVKEVLNGRQQTPPATAASAAASDAAAASGARRNTGGQQGLGASQPAASAAQQAVSSPRK